MNNILRTNQMVTKHTVLAVLLTIFIFAVAATGSAIGKANDDTQSGHKDIVDIASSSDTFSTLVAAVKAAGLVETLKGDGPFTVFAPTNKAFANLPAGTVDDLLLPENRDVLVQILTYHVVPGRITSDQLLNASSAPTASGKSLPIGLSIGNASIVKTDIEASNGVIHVIDSVLMPEIMSRSENAAANLIRASIERGAPLYNNGQPAACAAVYEMTAMALLQLDDDMPRESRRALKSALKKMKSSHDSRERAWIMREGLDDALAAMSPRRMSITQSGKH